MKGRRPRERVYLEVLRNYYPDGFVIPLLKQGERTWVEGRGTIDNCRALESNGYVRIVRVEERTQPRKHGLRYNEILERLKSGAFSSDIAKELGVTRSYVLYVKCDAEREAAVRSPANQQEQE